MESIAWIWDLRGEKITVYFDGNNGQPVRVNGCTTVNFVRR